MTSAHVAMHLARELTGASLLSIGRHFGRDHTPVIYAHRRLRQQLREDPQTRDPVEELPPRAGSAAAEKARKAVASCVKSYRGKPWVSRASA